jgi:hypothetical protein
MSEEPGMDRDEDLIAQWSELLTVDGAAPPPPLVSRCADLFGPSPDYVLTQRLPEDGTRWHAVVITAGLFGCAEAHSTHPSWDAAAYVQQLGHDEGATYECWATPIREITRVSTLPVADDGRHWRPGSIEAGGAILTSWRVHLRDGTEIDLPVRADPADPARPVDPQIHERAEEIAVTLLKALAL